MAMLNPPGRALGSHNAILSGCGTRHHVGDFSGPISIKAVLRGEAVWETDEGHFKLDREQLLVLNAGRRYSLTIDSRQPAETLVACFQNGIVEDAQRVRSEAAEHLLDDPERRRPVLFLETIRRATPMLVDRMLQLRSALRRDACEVLQIEELFGELARQLLAAEGDLVGGARRVPAIKSSTRLELFRRACRARDFIEAETAGELTLERIARAACLSPFHCHRLFLAVFGETPHAYVTRRRLERARSLLLTADVSVTEACLRVGFSSLGSFSSRFSRAFGVSPGALRRARRSPTTSS